jgi:hypothetical protein
LSTGDRRRHPATRNRITRVAGAGPVCGRPPPAHGHRPEAADEETVVTQWNPQQWKPIQVTLPDTVFTGAGTDRIHTTLRIDGIVFDVHGIRATESDDGVQILADEHTTRQLLTLYPPDKPYSTLTVAGQTTSLT